jgi:hypothetical protein
MVKRGFLIAALAFFFLACDLPSNEIVKKEFLDKNLGMEVANIELIFEQDNNVVYLISYKKSPSSEIQKQDFAMKSIRGKWQWCDDNTEQKCK